MSESAFEVGKAYLIRTVTMYYVGRVTKVGDTHIVLSDASWVADTGRYSTALAKGPDALVEVEKYPDDVIVFAGALVDAAEWPHALPTESK